MLAVAWEENEVLDAVVEPISISVMDNFALFQFPAEMPLHHKTVDCEPSPQFAIPFVQIPLADIRSPSSSSWTSLCGPYTPLLASASHNIFRHSKPASDDPLNNAFDLDQSLQGVAVDVDPSWH